MAGESTSEHKRSDTAQSAGRVVVGVDGSEGSITALAWGLREARLRGVGLHAVIAWSYHASGASGRGSTSAGTYEPQVGMLGVSRHYPLAPSLAETYQRDEADLAAIRDVLDTAVRRVVEQESADQRSVSVTSDVVEGPAAKVLLGAVSESDLLVVGSRGHGAFVGALLGSVSHHVVAQAPCPVVVVPNRA